MVRSSHRPSPRLGRRGPDDANLHLSDDGAFDQVPLCGQHLTFHLHQLSHVQRIPRALDPDHRCAQDHAHPPRHPGSVRSTPARCPKRVGHQSGLMLLCVLKRGEPFAVVVCELVVAGAAEFEFAERMRATHSGSGRWLVRMTFSAGWRLDGSEAAATAWPNSCRCVDRLRTFARASRACGLNERSSSSAPAMRRQPRQRRLPAFARRSAPRATAGASTVRHCQLCGRQGPGRPSLLASMSAPTTIVSISSRLRADRPRRSGARGRRCVEERDEHGGNRSRGRPSSDATRRR